jgi:4-amino-4-deoxy-L-arabinose transferase-like glycosyltransferase
MLAAILLVATALRLVALDAVPSGPGYDELQNARLAERVLAGRWAIYFPENHGQEPLYPLLEALAARAVGWSVFSIRLPGALAGVLATLALYLAGRRLAGERAALLAAAFYAVSFWPLIETRMALETGLLAPLAALAMYLLARGLDERDDRLPKSRRLRKSMIALALAGLFLGLHVYAYTPGRPMPALPLALLVYLLLLNRRTLRRRWPGLLVFCLVTLAVVLPLVLFLRAYPEAEERLGQLNGPLTALRQGDPRPVLQVAAGTLGMFSFRGEPQWLYNVAGRPVFDPLTALFFYAGLGMCLVRLRDWRRGVVLLWLLVGLSPAFVSPPAGSFTHTLAAQPAVYLLLAVGVDVVNGFWERIERKLPLTWRLIRSIRAVNPLTALLLMLNGALSGYAYFVAWANAPEVCELYQCGITGVARDLDAHQPPGPVAVAAPYVDYWNPWNVEGFDLALWRQDLSVRWFNPGAAWLWPAGAGPAVFYFPADPLGPQTFDPELRTLFLADATLLPTAGEDFTAFRVARPAALEERLAAVADTPLTWPPDLAHLSPPALPLVFGDRFALLGAELPQGAVKAGSELRLVTYWQVLAADPAPVVAFVHLTADGFDIWGQYDGLDVRPLGLQPGDRFAQVHLMPIKPETAPGTYHVQLGLYGPATLVRLPIAAGGGATADRVWVGEIQVQE